VNQELGKGGIKVVWGGTSGKTEGQVDQGASCMQAGASVHLLGHALCLNSAVCPGFSPNTFTSYFPE